MKTTILLIITGFALALSTANGVRIQIHLDKESVERYRRHVYKRAPSSACTGITEVSSSSLTFTQRLSQQINNGQVKFYRSSTATAMINSFLDMTKVPLAGVDRANYPTVRQVLNVLNGQQCYPFLFGGSVRDQFILGTNPNDADVEIDCSIDTFLQVCNSNWQSQNCKRSSGAPDVRGHIGVATTDLDTLDAATTVSTFFSPTYKLEYTVNALAYEFIRDNVFIDLSGNGITDVCASSTRLRIPTATMNQWSQWASSIGNDILRFWKFRSRGFVASDPDTGSFIVRTATALLNANGGKTIFGSFYCKNVYGGSYNSASHSCTASAQICADRTNANKYNNVLADDFGSYWTNTIMPNYIPACAGAVKLAYHTFIVGVLLLIAILLGS